MVQAWRIVGDAPVRLARHGDEVLALNPLSWETHLLTEPAASVVECLATGPLTLHELQEYLEHTWEALSSDDIRQAIVALERIGLVSG